MYEKFNFIKLGVWVGIDDGSFCARKELGCRKVDAKGYELMFKEHDGRA